jgi:hypothetical protein
MDQSFVVTDQPDHGGPKTDAPENAATDSTAVEGASTEYVGRWNRLLSTTNWEKGRIISQWRKRLIDAGAPAQAYSDEAWSRRVGNVSPQHVGRLRRVHDRFQGVYDQYPGLYWSHFQAALDWEDAEMWLEGAVESGWSVAQMRTTRWEALGAPAEAKPRPEDVVASEPDEDVDPALDTSGEDLATQAFGVVSALLSDEARDPTGVVDTPLDGSQSPSVEQSAGPAPVEFLKGQPPMPPDLTEACEALRQSIVRHRLSGWKEVSRRRVLQMLKALKQVALASA